MPFPMMKIHEQTIAIPKKRLDWIKKILSEEPKEDADLFKGRCIVDHECTFDDGFKVAIQVVEVLQFEEGGSNKPWSQGVLFDPNGCEIDCTEVSDEYDGAWYFSHNNEMYIVYVTEESEEAENGTD